MASHPPSRASNMQQPDVPSSNNTSRRNLFSSTLSRRPTANPSASASTATVRSTTSEEQTSEDIIVRDENGNYRLNLPHMTPLPRDEAREEREVENRLIETYMKHQQHIEPNELKATLQASLQAKVATLEEDKWMFENDDSPPQ